MTRDLTPSEQISQRLSELQTLPRELTDEEWELHDELEEELKRQRAVEEETPSYRQHAARIGAP